MSEKVFSLSEVAIAFEMYTKMLLLKESDQRKADAVKTAFLSMIAHDHDILMGSQDKIDEVKDSMNGFMEFLESKKEKAGTSNFEGTNTLQNMFSITGATSMTRYSKCLQDKRKTKETRSEPPKKTEGGIDAVMLRTIHKTLFESCEKKSFEGDKKFRIVSDHEVKAIEAIDEELDFKRNEYPEELNFLEVKYARIYYSSSELAIRAAISSSKNLFKLEGESGFDPKRNTAVINLAGRILKSCKYAGRKHAAEEVACKNLFFSDVDELKNCTFKVNRKTYFRYPSVCTPDIIAIKNDVGEILLIEVKSVEAKKLNTSTVKRQLANAMYVMNVKLGFIVSWGKYVVYRKTGVLSDVVRFPAKTTIKTVYSKLYPKEKKLGADDNFSLEDYEKVCVFVENGEGIISMEKLTVDDNAYKKLEILFSRGLGEYRKSLRYLGDVGFLEGSKDSSTFRKAMNQGFIEYNGNFSTGTMADLGFDKTLSRLHAKVVMSEKLLDLGCRLELLPKERQEQAKSMLYGLKHLLNILDDVDFASNDNIKLIDTSMRLAMEIQKIAVDGDIKVIESDGSKGDSSDSEDDSCEGIKKEDITQPEYTSHGPPEIPRTIRNRRTEVPELHARDMIESELKDFIGINPEIFYDECKTPHKFSGSKGKNQELGLTSMMKAKVDPLVSIACSPKYKMIHPNILVKADGVLGKRVNYSGSRTGFGGEYDDLYHSESDIPLDQTDHPRHVLRSPNQRDQVQADSSGIRRVINTRLMKLNLDASNEKYKALENKKKPLRNKRNSSAREDISKEKRKRK